MIDPNGYGWFSKVVKAVAAVAAVAVGVAAVVAAAPVIAAGVAGSCLAFAVCTAGAGVAAATFGAFELGEVVTNKNPLKDVLGEDLYNIGYVVSSAGSAIGTQMLNSGKSNPTPPKSTTKTTKAATKTSTTSNNKNVVAESRECLIAGTLVSAEKGSIAIENIQTGDFVWAENPETGEKGLKK